MMSVSLFSFRRLGLPRGLAASLAASLLALAFAPPAQAEAPVILGDAEAYSVLADSVTSTGATAMSENLGIFSSLPLGGAPAPVVLGETHFGDAAATDAKNSLDAAYGIAQLRSTSNPALPANFAGVTLTEGVHNASGAMGFTAGTTLTLDGDEDAVFIIQVGGAMSVGALAHVALVGGADACNVFWTVNGATTLGAGAKFAGTVMGTAAISVGAGARVDGRLLARAGAITLDSNAIRTACAVPEVVVGPPAEPQGETGADRPMPRERPVACAQWTSSSPEATAR